MLAPLARIPQVLLIGVIRLYQLTLSPHIGGQCRFAPTCSHYAIQALEQYGAVKGAILIGWRLVRCNPWGPHGYDPPRWFGEPKPENTIELPEVDTCPSCTDAAHATSTTNKVPLS